MILIGVDFDAKVLLINSTGCELLHTCESEVIGLDWFDSFVPADAREQARASFLAFARHEENGERPETVAEYEVVDALGTHRLIAWNRSLVRDADGVPVSVLSSGEDVTERRQIEHQLQFESYLLDSVSDSIMIHDHTGRILYANSAAAEMRGLTREELMARQIPSLVSPEFAGTYELHRDALQRGEPVIFETGHVRADGTVLPLEVHAAMIEYRGARAIASVGRDITERLQTEERIREMAFHDSLTGLANRMLFNDRLEIALGLARRRQHPVAVLFMDFDRFKETNDTYGHQAGDRLLAFAASRISARVRATDTVARFGGDEFAVVLHDIASADDARAVGESILGELQQPFELEGNAVRMPASIGVAVSLDGDVTADEIMRLADAAMYAAKHAGRGRIVCRVHAVD